MNQFNKKSGFTIVELMLAMSFVAVLLVTIAMIVVQIGSTYERGLTLKEVNQSGRAISSELQQNINSGLPFELITCTGANACNYSNNNTSGGRLCIGQYSYIWNYGNAINNNTTTNRYSGSNTVIRFAKVLDLNADYCSTALKDIVVADAVELLDVSQHNLAIQGFSMANSSNDPRTGQRLYSIGFLLGTNETNTVVPYTAGVEARCKTPKELNTADAAYCSINKFNVVIRAGSVK